MLQQSIKKTSDIEAAPIFGVLSNPTSTQNKSLLQTVSRVVEEVPPSVHRTVHAIEDIPAVLNGFRRAGVTHLVINGGDGTIQAVLSALTSMATAGFDPAVIVLPGGKTNLVARNLGLKGRPDRLLKRVMTLAEAGKLDDQVVDHPVVELDLGDGSDPRTGLFFGAAGLVGGLLWCRHTLYKRGLPLFLAHPLAFATLISGIMLNLRQSPLRAPLRIETDDGKQAEDCFTLAIATTLDSLLLKLRPFTQDGDGRLRVTAISCGPGAMARALGALATNRFGWGKGVFSVNADQVRLYASTPITLDGEVFSPRADRPVTLSARSSVRFVSLSERR